jgi:hypothetical protein
MKRVAWPWVPPVQPSHRGRRPPGGADGRAAQRAAQTKKTKKDAAQRRKIACPETRQLALVPAMTAGGRLGQLKTASRSGAVIIITHRWHRIEWFAQFFCFVVIA